MIAAQAELDLIKEILENGEYALALLKDLHRKTNNLYLELKAARKSANT